MKHYNLNHATVGWNLGGDCRGEGATPLYLPATRCLVLLVSGEGYDVIRVKRGLSELTQRRVRKDTKGVELEYCEETAPEPGVEVYWFAWQDALKPTVLSSRYQIHSVTAVISDT